MHMPSITRCLKTATGSKLPHKIKICDILLMMFTPWGKYVSVAMTSRFILQKGDAFYRENHGTKNVYMNHNIYVLNFGNVAHDSF